MFRAWTDEERSRVKQGFKLELSPHEEQATPPPAGNKSNSKSL